MSSRKWWMTLENKGHLFYATSSFVHHFKAMGEHKLELRSRNAQFRVKIGNFLACVTLKLDRWPWKIIGHIFYATSSFAHHFVAIGEFKLELQSGNGQFGSKSMIFLLCDLEIWHMTLKNNRAPLLSNIKICTSFRHHMWMKTRATVRKWLNRLLTSVTLTFHLWPWPFAWSFFCHW